MQSRGPGDYRVSQNLGGGLIFAFFAIFPAIPQTFFQQKITPEKIFSNLNSLHKNTVLRNRASFRNNTVYNELLWYYIGFAYGSIV